MNIARAQKGSSSVEFAMVLPLLILFVLGIIDAGRLMWTYNRAEKAAQMAARYAAVTDMIPSTLATTDFTLQANGAVPGGQSVPTSAFSSTTCTSGSCTGSWGYSATAFTNVVDRARFFMPEIAAANVQIRYENVGLGYAGDPNGPDVAPLITVSLVNLQFRPLVFAMFRRVTLPMPTVTSSVSGEDMVGNVSN
jgi:Flp pilus assembly protein TadG